MKRKLGLALRQRKLLGRKQEQQPWEAFLAALRSEVERAAERGYPYAVVAFSPQRLPGEDVSDIVKGSAQYLGELLRDGDIAGMVSDDVLVVGLLETEPYEVRVVAHRIQCELGMKAHRFRNTIWESGYACLPDDGLTADELVTAAIEATRSRRRRFTDWQAPPPASTYSRQVEGLF